MFHILRHLLHRALQTMPLFISTNWTGIIFTVVIFLLTQIAILCFNGWQEMRKFLGKNSLIGIFAVTVCWVGLFGWNVVQIVYEDHQNFVSQNAKLRQQATGLVDPRTRDEQITDLKGKIEALQKALRQSRSPEIRVFPVAHDNKPGIAKMEYVLTTGKPRTPVEIMATCDFPISAVNTAFLTYSGGYSMTTDHQRISVNQFRLIITSPVWATTTPLFTTIFFDPTPDRMPSCRFLSK